MVSYDELRKLIDEVENRSHLSDETAAAEACSDCAEDETDVKEVDEELKQAERKLRKAMQDYLQASAWMENE